MRWSIQARRLPDEPFALQSLELAERSVFLPGIPVTNRLETDLYCLWAGQCSGTRKIQSPGTAASIENLGSGPSRSMPKEIDIGALPPGETTITALAGQAGMAVLSAGRSRTIDATAPAAWSSEEGLRTADLASAATRRRSPPDTRRINVLRSLPEWLQAIQLRARKSGRVVVYSGSFKWPEPPFKVQVEAPRAIPFLGGQQIGIDDSQFGAAVMVKSTGKGAVRGDATTAFEAMWAAGSTGKASWGWRWPMPGRAGST
jgi:hypothetical protein